MKRSILLVFAHPDDESFGLAGTIAKYAARGVPSDLVCATRGEKGTRLGVPAGADTGTAREAELRAAARIAGIRHIYLLGYTDGELDAVDPGELAGRVMQIMRRAEPEVVITFGPDGITGHKDHIAIGKAATAAFKQMADSGGGPRKLYYVTIPQSLAAAGDIDVFTRPDNEVTTVIDISGYLDKKLEAIAAHRSQQDAADFVEMLRQDRDSGLAAREFLYLAFPKPSARETDLFQ